MVIKLENKNNMSPKSWNISSLLGLFFLKLENLVDPTLHYFSNSQSKINVTKIPITYHYPTNHFNHIFPSPFTFIPFEMKSFSILIPSLLIRTITNQTTPLWNWPFTPKNNPQQNVLFFLPSTFSLFPYSC